MQVIVVTGLSGSGKSVAIRQLEDSGYYCIDNLPIRFIVPVIEGLAQDGKDRVAVSVDVRSGSSPDEAAEQYRQLEARHYDLRILVLTASTPTLVRRYSETRRRHPLTPLDRNPGDQTGLQEAIMQERQLVRLEDGFLLDTTDLSASALRTWIRQFIAAPASELTLSFESFAFKKGIPVAADLVFDVRNLPNPHYDPALRPLTGKDEPVRAYFRGFPEVDAMITDIEAFIRKWLPSYRAQDRHYLTVCIGCTGGQHRSVYTAEELGRRFSGVAGTVVRHRALAAAGRF